VTKTEGKGRKKGGGRVRPAQLDIIRKLCGCRRNSVVIQKEIETVPRGKKETLEGKKNRCEGGGDTSKSPGQDLGWLDGKGLDDKIDRGNFIGEGPGGKRAKVEGSPIQGKKRQPEDSMVMGKRVKHREELPDASGS